MLRMPDGSKLTKEMIDHLPLTCYSKKSNTKVLAAQGLRLSEKTALKVIGVHDLGEAAGVSCNIEYGGSVLVMSITGLDFTGNGIIDSEILEYQEARVEWLKQEERRDLEQGLEKRIQSISLSPIVSRNAPCPCGSGKKYKQCCGKH